MSFNKISTKLDESYGVMTLPLSDLAILVNRKTVNNTTPFGISLITNELDQRGIGYLFPTKLTNNSSVRLYRKGTKIGNFIETLSEVYDDLNKNKINDKELKSITEENEDAKEMVAQIRRLIKLPL